MAKMYWEKDANPKALAGKRIAVLGYGSQGRAQALNLRDSGLDVVLGQRPGGTFRQARRAGRLEAAERRRSQQGRRRDRDAHARYDPARRVQERCDAKPERRRHAAFLPRLQHSLRPDHSAEKHRRHHDRAEELPATWSAASTKRAAAFPACWPSIRITAATPSSARSATPALSAARTPG